MSDLPASMEVLYLHAPCPWRPKEHVRAPGPGVTAL